MSESDDILSSSFIAEPLTPDAVSIRLPVEVIVKSVPSLSIFSPPIPYITPISLGIFMSPDAAVRFISPPELTVRSVPSLEIFSASSVANDKSLVCGILTFVVAERMISAPEVTVKSVLSPSIFSPDPNNIPTLAGRITSSVAVRLIFVAAPTTIAPSETRSN